MDAEEKPVESDILKDRPLAAKNEASVSPNPSQDVSTFVHLRESIGQLGSFGSPGDRGVYPPNIYAPQAQAFYYRGYENAIGEWDEYPLYANAERMEIGSPGVCNDNGSIVYHAGYGYGPQMPYGPYSPVTTPMPVSGDPQLYSPQQYPFSGAPYFQQMSHPSSPYITSPSPQPELNTLASIDQQGDSMLFGPRSSFPPLMGSIGGGNFPGNLGTHGFHDLQPGFDGSRSSGLWSDWPKHSDGHKPLTPLSPAVSPLPIGPYGSYGQNVGMGSQQQRSFYGIGSGSNSYARGYTHNDFNEGPKFGSASISSFGTNRRSWVSLESSKRRGRASFSLCGCSGSVDFLGEQNRGPRASKPKSQSTVEHSSADNNNNNDKYSKPTAKISDESYNQSDFVTEYKDAKFFIIKSYSEDNVHKSIKYGVWASTPNGNRKLDAAYREAKEKHEPLPIFLLFSVNASGQFCGVAEMVGSVDFDKSVDYWQQDKWSGQFPVKWHLIKDVPNSQFRHIVLENNDKKPVTNSRDTQEVKLLQGIEMLNMFKKYETDMSILDDFEFYEDRQKAMQERKARQQASLIGAVAVGKEHRNAVALPGDFMKQMSKSFAQVVGLDETSKEGPVTDRGSNMSDSSVRVKVEDGITSVSSGKAS